VYFSWRYREHPSRNIDSRVASWTGPRAISRPSEAFRSAFLHLYISLGCKR
jgi:hypothetical protein